MSTMGVRRADRIVELMNWKVVESRATSRAKLSVMTVKNRKSLVPAIGLKALGKDKVGVESLF